MFDKDAKATDGPSPPARRKIRPGDERIALRCNHRELQVLDSLVATGDFESRSELMRRALHEFIRRRAEPKDMTPLPGIDPKALLEVPVRLRREEIETIDSYGDLVANGQPREDLLAQLVRRGELELKVVETVARSRAAVHEAAEARERIRQLGRSAEDLERRGVVGR